MTSDATTPPAATPERQSIHRRLARTLALTGSAAAMIALIAGGVIALHMRADAVPSAAPLPPLTVAATPIELLSHYEITDRFLGRLEAARRTALAFERGGLIREVLVEEGDRIAAGDVIAQLDTEPLLARRDALVAQRREAEALLDLAQLTSQRQEELTGMGFASQQRFDETRLSVAAGSARLEAIAAQIRTLEIDIEKSTLTAPFSGVIALRSMDEGAVIAAGAEIVELLETDRMHARIGLPPRLSGDLQPGQVFSLTVADAEHEARLIAVRPDLEMGTRTVEAVFELADGDGLPVGEVVELRIARAIAATGAWLPLSALKEDEKGLWTVLTVERDENGLRVAREAVEIVHVADGRVFVRGTLAAGTWLLTDGTNRVVPGQSVVIGGSS
jgi:RND family efflux transporter MFP subunit